MTPEQEKNLRSRLLELRSLRQIYQVIEDLSKFQATEPFALPFFVRSVLQDLAWRLEGIAVNSEAWVRVHQQLTPPVGRVLDACKQDSRDDMIDEMNRLVHHWTPLKEELR